MELSVLDNQLIITKTDLKGYITYANPYFLELVGYEEKDILYKPHNIIRHPDMPKAIFLYLWKTIESGNEVNAFVKNKTKSGDYYWVKANVTPSYQNDKIVGYFSVRRKANTESIRQIETIYRRLSSIEKSSGVKASIDFLKSMLKDKGVSYEEFISEL